MKIRILIITSFIAAIVLLVSALAFYGVRNYLSDEDRLVSQFKASLESHDYRVMYQGAADMVKLNNSEDEFVRRMTIIEQTLRDYDPDMNFQRDIAEEDLIKSIRRDSEPDRPDDGSLRFVVLRTRTDDKSATVLISWIRNGVQPRLFDLRIRDGISGAVRIQTLAGRPFRPGEE